MAGGVCLELGGDLGDGEERVLIQNSDLREFRHHKMPALSVITSEEND